MVSIVCTRDPVETFSGDTWYVPVQKYMVNDLRTLLTFLARHDPEARALLEKGSRSEGMGFLREKAPEIFGKEMLRGISLHRPTRLVNVKRDVWGVDYFLLRRSLEYGADSLQGVRAGESIAKGFWDYPRSVRHVGTNAVPATEATLLGILTKLHGRSLRKMKGIVGVYTSELPVDMEAHVEMAARLATR